MRAPFSVCMGALALAAALTGCGGGGVNTTPVTPGGVNTPTPMPSVQPSGMPTSMPSSQLGPTGTVTVNINLSVAPGTTSNARSSAGLRTKQSYFSAKTQSVALFVRTVNGVAPSSFIFTEVNVGGANSPCTITNGTASCSLSIAAPVGNDTFQLMTYATPNGSTHPLSIGNGSATVALNQATNLPITLLPVVSNVTYTLTPTSAPLNASQTFTLALTPLDSAGSVIGGSDNFYSPIVVSSTATNAHLTPSIPLPATFATPNATAPNALTMSFAYDGLGAASSYTFQFAVPGDAFSGSVLPTAVTISFTSATQHLYVTTQAPNQVLVYDINADGSISANPSRTITGASTGLTQPVSIWVDAEGAIYVNNINTNVVEFAPGANGNVAPDRTLAAGNHPVYVGRGGSTEYAIITQPNYPTDTATRYIAFGSIYPTNPGDGPVLSAGNGIYVGNANSFAGPMAGYATVCAGVMPHYDSTGDGYVECFPNPVQVDGSQNPTAGYTTASDGALNVAIRPDGKLVVVNGSIYGGPGVNVSTYAPGGGNTPLTQLMGSNTGFGYPQAVAFDTLGNMYVANEGLTNGGAAILQFPQNATGNVAPTRVVGYFNYGYGVAVGP